VNGLCICWCRRLSALGAAVAKLSIADLKKIHAKLNTAVVDNDEGMARKRQRKQSAEGAADTYRVAAIKSTDVGKTIVIDNGKLTIADATRNVQWVDIPVPDNFNGTTITSAVGSFKGIIICENGTQFANPALVIDGEQGERKGRPSYKQPYLDEKAAHADTQRQLAEANASSQAKDAQILELQAPAADGSQSSSVDERGRIESNIKRHLTRVFSGDAPGAKSLATRLTGNPQPRSATLAITEITAKFLA
jgi:hypothetical protein